MSVCTTVLVRAMLPSSLFVATHPDGTLAFCHKIRAPVDESVASVTSLEFRGRVLVTASRIAACICATEAVASAERLSDCFAFAALGVTAVPPVEPEGAVPVGTVEPLRRKVVPAHIGVLGVITTNTASTLRRRKEANEGSGFRCMAGLFSCFLEHR